MKRLSVDEIKKIELDILIEFDNFCKKENLVYYLVGGTLLGAIRHKGFIPWDDDIDICMPRPDYEKMLVKFNSSFSSLQLKSFCFGNFDAPFSKIVNTNTKVDYRYSNGNIDTNLWIDIFPIDGLPENIQEVKKIYIKAGFYRRFLLLCDAKLGEGKSFIKILSKYILKPIACMYGRKRWISRIEELANSYHYEKCIYVGAITWGLYGIGERMLKAEFERCIKVEFENHLFPAFSCWDSYLKGLYGNYMQLPPIEKRKTHDIIAYLVENGDL